MLTCPHFRNGLAVQRHMPDTLMLALPLVGFLLLAFLIPIGASLIMAVDGSEVAAALPRTSAALGEWGDAPLPGEAVHAALVADLAAADDPGIFGAMTRRLNFEQPGFRSLMMRTKAAVDGLSPPYAASLLRIDPNWARMETWDVLRTSLAPLTASYFLRTLDLRLLPNGGIGPVANDQAIFRTLFARTLEIGLCVTLLCVVLGYPAAWLLAFLSGRVARLGLLCVLVPFWTSTLIRSVAWFILLQREGPINAALHFAGLTDAPLALIFTRPAVYIAMVHVLLPFFILPLYSVMKRVDSRYLHAAASLGASPWSQFLHVYLPLTVPGVAAGGLIVFVLAVGFYVTPALVGGVQDQMVGYYIEYFTNTAVNAGMAAALSILMLLFTALVIWPAVRFLPSRTDLAAKW